MEYCAAADLSMAHVGPEHVSGFGNYFIDIAADGSEPSLRLFFLDSHAYMRDGDIKTGYDYIKPGQIAYFKEHTSPDVPSLVFFHIPPPQTRFMGDRSLIKGLLPPEVPFERVGQCFDPPQYSEVDSGIYEAMKEQGR
jgi:hypothetical protein